AAGFPGRERESPVSPDSGGAGVHWSAVTSARPDQEIRFVSERRINRGPHESDHFGWILELASTPQIEPRSRCEVHLVLGPICNLPSAPLGSTVVPLRGPIPWCRLARNRRSIRSAGDM